MMYREAIERYLEGHGFGSFTPKAVLFDMDGVLYDSMPNHAVSWHNSMKAFGLDIAPEEAYLYEGMRGVETIRLLARRQWGVDLPEERAAEIYALKSEMYAGCPRAGKIDGVEDLMGRMKAMGLGIMVVTGSGQRTLLDRIVEDFGGLVAPGDIISSRDVAHGKPDPEPYLRGLERAGISPWEGVIVENAPLGVRAGVAAGVFTIAVNTGPLPDSVLASEGANLVFPDMRELCAAWEAICRRSS